MLASVCFGRRANGAEPLGSSGRKALFFRQGRQAQDSPGVLSGDPARRIQKANGRLHLPGINEDRAMQWARAPLWSPHRVGGRGVIWRRELLQSRGGLGGAQEGLRIAALESRNAE